MFWHCHSRFDDGQWVLLQLQKFSGGENHTDFINANFKLAKTPLEIGHFGSHTSTVMRTDRSEQFTKISSSTVSIHRTCNIPRTTPAELGSTKEKERNEKSE